jgi:SAM-dependent methyltransferase
MFETQTPNRPGPWTDHPDPLSSPIDPLTQLAIRDGWRSALNQYFRSDPGVIRYVTDPARSRFVELLPLTRESTILELGSSHGQITTVLAQRAGFVHGLELDPAQAEFAAFRCRQEGHSHVSITCGGGDCLLPYADKTFDGVVINLVMEWCVAKDPSADHQQSQQRLLKEAARVLKPQGWLFLATKNRFGMSYLIGGRDEHTYNWRFGQALPRWLLALLLRLHGRSRTAGLIHSYNGLCRLLIDAGFGQLQPIWAVPEYRFPTELIPADAKSIREARKHPGFVQGPSRKTRLLMRLVPAPLVKYVMPGLIFLARKEAR